MSTLKSCLYYIEYKNGYRDEMTKEMLEESVDDNVSLIQLESSDSGRDYWEKMGFVQKESINGNPQMGDITPYYFLAVSPDEIGKELK